MTLRDEAAERSLDLLHRALHPAGYVASPSDEHYASIWGRDAAMACLGASRSQDPVLIGGVEATLHTLAELSTPLGQVPNVYWPDRGYWDWGEGGTTDATAWLVIASPNMSRPPAATRSPPSCGRRWKGRCVGSGIRMSPAPGTSTHPLAATGWTGRCAEPGGSSMSTSCTGGRRPGRPGLPSAWGWPPRSIRHRSRQPSTACIGRQ